MNNAFRRKTLIYYSEFFDNSYGRDDSLIRGLIENELRHLMDAIVVHHNSDSKTYRVREGVYSIPIDRRGRFIEELQLLYDVGKADYVVVRNSREVMRSVLRNRNQFRYKAGFHPTFPHALRGLQSAKRAGKFMLPRQLKYWIARVRQNRIVCRSDFVISSAPEMIESEAVRARMKFFRIHNGIDTEILPNLPSKKKKGERLRFVYVGSMEKAREMSVVLRAFDELVRDDWQLDIYTKDVEEAEHEVIRSLSKHRERVVIVPAMARETLFSQLLDYHVGLNLIPTTPVYTVSSPIKLLEYFACGVTVIMTPLPACIELFEGQGCGWFCAFSTSEIVNTLNQVLSTSVETLESMGRHGREIVVRERSYKRIATDFYAFLNTV